MLSISLFRLVVCCVAGARWVAAQGLTAWWTGVGAQVVYQNASTGNLMYTIDTGSGTGAEGFTPWRRLAATITPKNGTALAGTGYSDGAGNLFGQLFYLSRDNDIVEALLTCSLPTATCILQGNSIISSGVTTGINPNTSLAAMLRSANDGYRIFFHDTAGTLRQINYSGPMNITWGQASPVISQTGQIPNGIAVDGAGNLTVYGIDGGGNILVSMLTNGTWKQTSSISHTNLPSFTPSLTTLFSTTSSISSSNNTTTPLKSLFYIGTDRTPHHLTTANDWHTFSIPPIQPPTTWPLADTPNAPFAMTSTGDCAQMFYMSGGNLVMASSGSSNAWNPAVTIFANGNSTAASVGKNAQTEKGGLDTKALIGVWLGIFMGVIAIISLSVLGYILLKRRKSKSNGESAVGRTKSTGSLGAGGAERENKPPVPDKDTGRVVRHELGLSESFVCSELPSPSPSESGLVGYRDSTGHGRVEKG